MLTSHPTHAFSFFFFNDTATTEIYTLSLHDALPISPGTGRRFSSKAGGPSGGSIANGLPSRNEIAQRSEEHTSELQSRSDLVCRLLLEKKKKHNNRSREWTTPPRCGLAGSADVQARS